MKTFFWGVITGIVITFVFLSCIENEEAPDLQESIERPSGSNQPPNKTQLIYL